MKHKPWNLHAHELIGLRASVIDRKSGKKIAEGLIIDETYGTFSILCDDGNIKKFIKHGRRFRFLLPTGVVVEVDGKNIVGRPEDRVKKI